MSSLHKKKKLANCHCVCGVLKNKKIKLSRILFFTSANRKFLKLELISLTNNL